jgi:hypothetical protein
MIFEEGNFTDLKLIIGGLRKEEIRLVRERLSGKGNSDRVTNSSKLFEYLLVNQENSEEMAMIYMRETRNAFVKTVSRLLEKLDYILLSEANIADNTFYSTRFRTVFSVTNKILAAEYYRTKGIPRRADLIVREAIEQCKAIEEYGQLVDLLFLQYKWMLLRGQKSEAVAVMQDIEHYEHCRKALFETVTLYHDLGAKITRYATPQIKDEILSSIEVVRAYAEQTQSLQIRYYNLILQFNVAVEFNEHQKLHDIAQEFYDLVTDNELLRKDQNIGIANLYFADACLVSRDFKQALEYAAAAKQYFAKNTYNYFHTEELEFYALFFSNNFIAAEESLLNIIRNPAYTDSKYLENKKEYLMACVYFAQERYQEASRLLNSISEIPKDKTGWNLGVKNLGVMLAIVRGDYDLLVRIVDSYERDLKRIRKTAVLRKRDLLIYKLFRRYTKYSNAADAIESLGEEFTTLSWPDPEYVQIIPGHELISINAWFESLARSTRYAYTGQPLVSEARAAQ